MVQRPPVTDAVLVAVARLVDDSQVDTREPSHSALEWCIKKAGLESADPNKQSGNPPVGKEKRVRHVLSWAVEHEPDAGERLVVDLLGQIKGLGGFRPESPNYVGTEPIANAQGAFREEGFDLSADGVLRPPVLENLTGPEMTMALMSYVMRAKRGVEDAALLTGTAKDLLEATAAHVIRERRGSYPSMAHFPQLLGLAFTEMGLATQHTNGETPQQRVERCLYELGCAVNGLRNKQGTGHGRPFLSTVTDSEAKAAVEAMGTISERLLAALAAMS